MKQPHSLVIFIVILGSWHLDASAQNVNFSDANLAAAIRSALSLGSTDPITATALAGFWTMFEDNAKRISQQRAQIILPLLIERARERRTISFGKLAERFDLAWAMPIRPSIVCITGTLYRLERNELCQAKFKWEHGKIPRITNMVTRVNGKPSRWVEEHLEKRENFQPLLDRIYDYDHWGKVLKVLGLQ